MRSAEWPAILVPLTSGDDAILEVVMFPCAGSGPSEYHGWRELVPEKWRLSSACLPGRGQRASEPLETRLTRIADEAAAAIVTALPPDRPVLLVGHSLGAVIAFEVALRSSPLALAIFACPPPHQIPDDPAPDLAWDEVIARMSGGTDLPPDLVAELIEVNRPVVAADIAMLDTYTLDGRRTRCDIWAMYGSDDYVAPGPWTEQTIGAAETVILPGGHYLPCDDPERAIGELVRRIDIAQTASRNDQGGPLP